MVAGWGRCRAVARGASEWMRHSRWHPEAAYTDLGADHYERRANIRRQARNHIRGLERLGYKVTIEPIDPATGELQAAAS